jgi:hypothetical protein
VKEITKKQKLSTIPHVLEIMACPLIAFRYNYLIISAPMLIKLSPILQVFARQREEKKEQPLTRKEWINADRIVMAILIISVIIGAIIFS